MVSQRSGGKTDRLGVVELEAGRIQVMDTGKQAAALSSARTDGMEETESWQRTSRVYEILVCRLNGLTFATPGHSII